MQSLKELYRIGKGPSSSHTIGPERACKLFLAENADATSFTVRLYGSLAKTGEGHGTGRVIESVLPNVTVENDVKTECPHPNTMDLIAYRGRAKIAQMRVYSVGGGAIKVDGRAETEGARVYEYSTMADIRAYCERENIRLCDYVFACEGVEIKDYLAEVWNAMKAAVARGVSKKGVLPGGLDVERRAKVLYDGVVANEGVEFRENRLVCAYAFAVSEENASGGTIVTAPTCGACGVLPAVLVYSQEKKGVFGRRNYTSAGDGWFDREFN